MMDRADTCDPRTEQRKPLVSIIIPSRNEASDIGATLDACVHIEYAPKEILVVDDSVDETPQLVSGYSDRGVRLIHRTRNDDGCCGARNLGMREARGEIVVLMNADNRPSPDFLNRLVQHYERGNDFVVVESKVLNPNNRWSRYVYASHLASKYTDPDWSEGFSCRKAAAQAVGFIPGRFPIPFCRDSHFGVILRKRGFVKQYDSSIQLGHVAPDSLRGFWANRTWRGSFSPLHRYYMAGAPLPVVLLREMARGCRTIAKTVLLIPALLSAWKLHRYAKETGGTYLDSVLTVVVANMASVVGAMRGIRRLVGVQFDGKLNEGEQKQVRREHSGL